MASRSSAGSGPSRSGRWPTAVTAWPATRARSSSCATRCPVSASSRGSPRAGWATASCAPTPSRCSRPLPAASRPRARMPPPASAVGATSSTRPSRRSGSSRRAVVREQFARIAGLEVEVDVRPVPGRRGRSAVAHPRRVRRRRVRSCRPAAAPLPRHRAGRRLPHRHPGGHRLRRPRHRVARPRVGRRRGRRPPGRAGARPAARARGWRAPAVGSSASSPATATGRASTSSPPVASGRSTRARPRPSCPGSRPCSAPRPGDRVVDLYAGSGLFTMRLGELVAPDGFVLGVEGDRAAVENGVVNTEHLDNVEWRANRVDRELRSLVGQDVTADLAVLDPPRTGAGKDVMGLLARMGSPPRRLRRVRPLGPGPGRQGSSDARLRPRLARGLGRLPDDPPRRVHRRARAARGLTTRLRHGHETMSACRSATPSP